jgi:hypothetical protein
MTPSRRSRLRPPVQHHHLDQAAPVILTTHAVQVTAQTLEELS